MRLRLRMACYVVGWLACCGRGAESGPWMRWVKHRIVFTCAWVLMRMRLHVRVRVRL